MINNRSENRFLPRNFSLTADATHVIGHYIPRHCWIFTQYKALALFKNISIDLLPTYLQVDILLAMGNTTEPDVSSLLAQIDKLGKSLSPGSKQDVETRKKLRIAARDLCGTMEEPGDIVERVCFSVRNSLRPRPFHLTLASIIANTDDSVHQFMEEVSIRIAINLDLFNILVKSGKPQTLDDLTKATGADPVLLGIPLARPPHTDR